MKLLDSLWQDTRLALRVLRKSPAATALSILSLTLGIGLTTGVFSVGNALLLRPFSFARPSEVFQVNSLGDDGKPLYAGWDDYRDMSRAAAGLLDMAVYQGRGVLLTQGDETGAVSANPVTPNYFDFLGVHAALGRASLETVAGRPGIVLGHQLWDRRFGADPRIVGQTVIVNGKALTVTGVMPATFTGLERGAAVDTWVAMDTWFDVLGHTEEKQGRNGQFEFVVRLKPGVTPQRAAALLDAAIRGPGKHKPAPAGAAGTWLVARFAPGWKNGLLMGGGLALVLGLVLFVACVNVAQLRMAQAETRKKEFGVRMALGAGPGRVARLLLTETALVSAAGAFLGLLLARQLIDGIAAFIASAGAYSHFIDLGMIRIDNAVLAFTVAMATLSVLMAGLAPARYAARWDVSSIIKSEQGAGGHGRRQRRFFMGAQVAISVALFGVALLSLQSLRNGAAMHPGMDPQKNLLVLAVGPGWDSRQALWCEQASQRLAGLPGVRGATFARRLPLTLSGGGATVRVEMPGAAPLGVAYNNVAGNYFRMMGTRLIAGRAIDPRDRAGSPPVVVVSQKFARQVFAGRDPLGQWVPIDGIPRQVVGIAADAPSEFLHETTQPFLYLPFAQGPWTGDITLLVETAGEPERLARAVRHELKQFDPRSVVYETITLRDVMRFALLGDRFMVILSASLGVFGFLLTAAGLFGVIQYAVHCRTREIGVRTALGARPDQIQTLVLGESLRMTAWGILSGLVLLGAVAWLVRSLVLGVGLLNPAIYLGSAAAAVALALLAGWWPARRATRVDPMAALRIE
ncbi:MAG TPA: ADOP family duplicated permease [Bryobacteraceae bacterium]|nr:ADOP family duplicated permease [Bryobacteraceae bacterium]